jgi:hypothetical protein
MNIKIHELKNSAIISTGKKVFLILAFIATAFVQKSFSQDKAVQVQQPSQLLSLYYNIKDALVKSDAATAALNAEQFVKTINGISDRTISEENRNALLKDAGVISDSKDIKKQRQVFANLSSNMYALAKAMKLSTDAVYYNYCPMKKSYWLSNNKVIKNPYFGTAMLTCGKVTETIE